MRPLVILVVSAVTTVVFDVGLIAAADYQGTLGTGLIPVMEPQMFVEKIALARNGGHWDLLILGASHLMFMHPEDLEPAGIKALNLAIPGATPIEVERLAKIFEAAGGTAEATVISLDYLMLILAPRPRFQEDGRPNSPLADTIHRDSSLRSQQAYLRWLTSMPSTHSFTDRGGLQPPSERYLLGEPLDEKSVPEDIATQIAKMGRELDKIPTTDPHAAATPWVGLARPNSTFVIAPWHPDVPIHWWTRDDVATARQAIESILPELCLSGSDVVDLHDWVPSNWAPFGFYDVNHLDRSASRLLFDQMGQGNASRCSYP